MSSIITGIMSSTAGFLWSKARCTTAAKLRDGDVTDEKICEIIVRELDDIGKKLDGRSRTDLLSSCTLVQEGVDLLYVSLRKSNLEQKSLVTERENDRAKTSRMTTEVESEILNEATKLSRVMEKLKLNADSECKMAKKRFEDAGVKANDGFTNEALSLKDKIFAVELRMVSEILECLDNPEIAITECLSFLKKLHSLPAIQEVFNVYINGRVKPFTNKAELVDNVQSVLLINYVLFKYASKFSSEYSFVLAWPTIELTDRSFNPILHWQEVSTRKSMRYKLPQHPSERKLTDRRFHFDAAVNGYGHVVTLHAKSVTVIISKTGERREVELPATYRECEIVKQCIRGVAVDKNNNIYVGTQLKSRKANGIQEFLYLLYILDENYNVKQECKFDFASELTGDRVRIAVNKNNDIAMSKVLYSNEVFVCDDRGNLKHKFKREQGWLGNLGISNKNEIMVPSGDAREVHTYSENGNLRWTIKLPEGHDSRGVAFHFVFNKIIVLTYVEKKDSYFLLCYTEEGELQTTTYFCKEDYEIPIIKSHPSGPLAVVTQSNVTFI